MNVMMPISHRLYAAAVNEDAAARKPRHSAGRSTIIELEQVDGSKGRGNGCSQRFAPAVSGRWGGTFRIY